MTKNLERREAQNWPSPGSSGLTEYAGLLAKPLPHNLHMESGPASLLSSRPRRYSWVETEELPARCSRKGQFQVYSRKEAVSKTVESSPPHVYNSWQRLAQLPGSSLQQATTHPNTRASRSWTLMESRSPARRRNGSKT